MKKSKLLIILLTSFLVTACGKSPLSNSNSTISPSSPNLPTISNSLPPPVSSTADSIFDNVTYKIPKGYVTKDGKYTEQNQVAAYIIIFQELPSNYSMVDGVCSNRNAVTYKGMSCGGKYHGNKEGHMPTGNYQELDIAAPIPSQRGTKRIVFEVNKFKVYYTSDHYSSFKLFTSHLTFSYPYPMN